MTSSVLVTGASRGLGLATALAFADAGHQVFATMRTPSRAPEALAQAGAVVLELDVTRPDSIEAALGQIRERTGRGPDIVVNNAATGVIASLEELRVDELRYVLETNVVGAFSVCKAAVSEMRERGRGRIVNVGSIGGRVATPGLGSYSASKFALAGLTSALRRELRAFGVQVVLVEPGAVRTDLIGPTRPVGEGIQRGAEAPYEPRYAQLDQLMQLGYERVGMEPGDVGRRLVDISTCPRPRARYAVGLDAHCLTWLSRLGEGRVQDALLDRSFGVIMAHAPR